MRIKFKKGKQREFLKEVLQNANVPSLRELRKRGFDVSYPTLKNYFVERRNMSYELFEQLCEFSSVDKNKFVFKILDDNYGQIKGGKKSRK